MQTDGGLFALRILPQEDPFYSSYIIQIDWIRSGSTTKWTRQLNLTAPAVEFQLVFAVRLSFAI